MEKPKKVLSWTAYLGIFLFIQSVTSDKIFISPNGYISKVCESNCDASKEKSMVEHCKRGCRFFDLVQASRLLEVNDTTSITFCIDSCKEAYDKEAEENACIGGCNSAKRELDDLETMTKQLLDETEKQLKFFDSVFNSVASYFWNGIRDDDSSEYPDDFVRVEFPALNDAIARENKLDLVDDDDVEIFQLNGNQLRPLNINDHKPCSARSWFHSLSYVLLAMGTTLLFFVSCYYMIALYKQKKAAKQRFYLDSAMPPSYETLIKNGYIDVCKTPLNAPAPIHKEKLPEDVLGEEPENKV